MDTDTAVADYLELLGNRDFIAVAIIPRYEPRVRMDDDGEIVTISFDMLSHLQFNSRAHAETWLADALDKVRAL